MRNKGVVWSLLLAIGLCGGQLRLAEAGVVKVHDWAKVCSYVPQEICTVDILIGIGYYIHLSDQDGIVVEPDQGSVNPYCNYAGYTSVEIYANFPAKLSVAMHVEEDVYGQWTASVAPELISPGITTIKIFVEGENVDVHELTEEGRQRVGGVTLSVVPR